MSEKFVVYEEKIETAVLIAVSTQMQNREKTEEYLDELAFLVETAGGVPVARFIQPLDHPNSVTYLGTGKLEEVSESRKHILILSEFHLSLGVCCSCVFGEYV